MTDSPTIETYWKTPSTDANVTPTNAESVAWPQTHSPAGVTDCGHWYQIDTYPTDEAETFTADGLLTYGEDFPSATQTGAISWRYEYGGDCPVRPEPIVTAASSWGFDCDSGLITTTATTSTVDFLLVGKEWIAQPAVTSEPVVTTTPTTTTECPVTVTAAPAELAYTGTGDIILPLVIGLALIGAGIAATRKHLTTK